MKDAAQASSEDDDHLGAHRPRTRRAAREGPARHHRARPRPIPDLTNLYIDLSWDEVAKYIVASPETIKATADLINRYPDRFLFGTDEVAPTDQQTYLKVYDMYAPLFAALTPGRRARRCGRATTSGSSTRPGGRCARGNGPTSSAR